MLNSIARLVFVSALVATGLAAEEFVVSTPRQPALPSDNPNDTGATRAHDTVSIPKEFTSYRVPGAGAVDVSDERGNTFYNGVDTAKREEKPDDGFFMKNQISKKNRNADDTPGTRSSDAKDPFFLDAATKGNLGAEKSNDRDGQGLDTKSSGKKNDPEFFFQPPDDSSTDISVGKEKKFYLRSEPEKTAEDGFLTKALKSVTGTAQRDTNEDSIETKPSAQSGKGSDSPSRHNVNIQLIEILEKQVKLLHDTGQEERAREVTKELLEAYAELASALKAQKMSAREA